MVAGNSRFFGGLFHPYILACLLMSLSMSIVAAPQQTLEDERERLMAEIDRDSHNAEARQAAIRAGKERSILCGHCHGVDGNSTKPDTPNLAGQNPAYLVEQIGKFASGERKNFVMQTLASNFTFEDKVNLALFFSSQQLKPVAADPDKAVDGQRIYESVCFRCHGANGRGEAGFARLAGQQTDYVQMTLKRYRANANRQTRSDEVRRTNASMEQVTAKLRDAEIEALAHFIALLK